MKSQRSWPAFLATLLGSLALGRAAQALDTRIFAVPLSGSQVVPPVATAGTGTCIVSVNDVTGAVSVQGSFDGLGSNAVSAHVHGPATVGMNAGIIIALTENGGTTGAIDGSGTLSAGQVTNLLNGLCYVDMHSSGAPGGEIRGQIVDERMSANQHMMVHTLMEAALAAVAQLEDLGNLQGLAWTSSYGASSWQLNCTGTLGGQALEFGYVGNLAAPEGQDAIVTFTGTGQLGAEPLLFSGETNWLWDNAAQDYVRYTFKQSTKVGANSLWGWVAGGEVVAGVATGIVVGVGVGTILPPGGVVAGVKAGAAATLGALGASEMVKNILALSASEPPPPPYPPFPSVPAGGTVLPAIGTLETLINNSGELTAKDWRGMLLLTGEFEDGAASGSMQNLNPVPSMPLWSVLAALAACVAWSVFQIRRR